MRNELEDAWGCFVLLLFVPRLLVLAVVFFLVFLTQRLFGDVAFVRGLKWFGNLLSTSREPWEKPFTSKAVHYERRPGRPSATPPPGHPARLRWISSARPDPRPILQEAARKPRPAPAPAPPATPPARSLEDTQPNVPLTNTKTFKMFEPK